MADEKQSESGVSLEEIQRKLEAKFPADKLEWRIVQQGSQDDGHWAMVLPYVDARAVKDRLDEAVGFFKWDLQSTISPNGVSCALTLYVPEVGIVGEKSVWRSGTAAIQQRGYEPVKSAESDAFKRAAAMFGIGRYLYDFPKMYARVSAIYSEGAKLLPTQDQKKWWWLPPELDSKYLPPDTKGK